MFDFDEAKRFRTAMDKAGTYLTDEQSVDVIDLFRAWDYPMQYVAGDKVRYADKLWKCLQDHTSQENWEPDKTPALWVEIAKPGEYREIKDAMLPTEAFALGEIGCWQTKDNLYRSLIDNNVYTPVSYPAGWEKVTE